MTSHFSLPPEISRKRVSKAGKALLTCKEGTDEYKDALELANQWRLAHLYPINTFQSRLRKMLKPLPGSIVAQRLKRMPTIIDKLERHPTMQLSTMQDIGGVRAIVKDVATVRDIVRQYETSKRFTHNLKDKKDYIESPKPDGYRGVHLVYRYNNTLARSEEAKKYTGLLIEVQVRTKEQHIWSTAVETMSTILRQPFKTRGGDKDWSDFFALMASTIAIVEDENVLEVHKHMTPNDIYVALVRKAKKLRALDLMTGYGFAAKLVHDNKGEGFYNIIELDMSTRTVRVKAYARKQYKRASADYAQLEDVCKGDVTKDVVMVSAGELKTLKKAYPNYFLDINKFAERLNAIIEIVDESA